MSDELSPLSEAYTLFLLKGSLPTIEELEAELAFHQEPSGNRFFACDNGR